MRNVDRSVHRIFSILGCKLLGRGEILPVPLFQKLIELERLRADRGGDPFAVVVFDFVSDDDAAAEEDGYRSNGHSSDGYVVHRGDGERSAIEIGRVLRRRARALDQIGWFDTHRVGALLPKTPYDGAVHFAEDVRSLVQRRAGVLAMVARAGQRSDARTTFEVFTYPTQTRERSNVTVFAESRRGENSRVRVHSRTGGRSTDSRSGDSSGSRETIGRRERFTRHGSTGSGFTRDEIAHDGITRDGITRDGIAHGQCALEPNDIRKLVSISIPAWKRTIDVLGSLVGLTLLFPLFLLIGLYIAIVSPGPVIFCQDRVGQGGKLFRCYKFRTMHPRPENERLHADYYMNLVRSNAPMEKLDDQKDPRIIPGARFLRKAGLDELPQLFNVLRGDMTLVGPRPCIPYEVREYKLWQAERFDVRPGLTGLWQVSGKNSLSFETMVRLDVRYASSLSFWEDVRILLATFPTIAKMLIHPVAARGRRGA